MTRPRSPDPADVIEATLRRLTREGPIQPALAAKQILADLAGHHITPTYTPPAGQRCANPADPHTGTALVSGRCPICGWRPNQ